ncbi:NACHT domain-containing protein, partial [Saccharothrix hoggarensis]
PDAPLGDAPGAPVAGLVSGMVFGLGLVVLLGVVLGLWLKYLVRRLEPAWAGLLPWRLRRFLRDSARRGLVVALDGDFRFLHGVLRDHFRRIDPLDGRPPPEPGSAGADPDDRRRRDLLALVREGLRGAEPDVLFPVRLVSGDARTTSAHDAFLAAGSALLIVGKPGSGTSTLLRDLAGALLAAAEADPDEPVPVLLDLPAEPVRGTADVVRPFTGWLLSALAERYGVEPGTALRWLADHRLVLLFDRVDRTARWTPAMLEEFLDAYGHPPVAVAGRDVRFHRPASLRVAEVELARGTIPSALSREATVGMMLRMERTGSVESYVEERLAGLPARARRWLAVLDGMEKELPLPVRATVNRAVLVPALAVAVGALPGLPPLAGVGVAVLLGLLTRTPVPLPWPRRLGGVAVGALLGAVLAAPLLLTAPDPSGWAVPFALSAWCVIGWVELPRLAVWAALVAAAGAYLVLVWDGFAWWTVAHVGAGAVTGLVVSALLEEVLGGWQRHVLAWCGLLPWRLGPFLAEVVDRGLVGRTDHGYRIEDPFVADAVAARPDPGDRDAPRA